MTEELAGSWNPHGIRTSYTLLDPSSESTPRGNPCSHPHECGTAAGLDHTLCAILQWRKCQVSVGVEKVYEGDQMKLFPGVLVSAKKIFPPRTPNQMFTLPAPVPPVVLENALFSFS